MWPLDVTKGHSKHEMTAAAAGIVWNSVLQKSTFLYMGGVHSKIIIYANMT